MVGKLTFIKLLELLCELHQLFLEVLIVTLLYPLVGYRFAVHLDHFFVLHIQLIKFFDRVLWDLVDVHVNLLEGGELTHSLNLFLF